MVNCGLLKAEICWRVWGTPAHFNGFRVLSALLHGTLLVGVSQTLRRWTEGATYIWQGGHHAGHWPTFIVITDTLNVEANCKQTITIECGPPGHHRTTLSVYIFATKACIDDQKKPVKQQHLQHMSYGELWPTSGWDRYTSGAPLQITTGFASWQRCCTAH